MTVLVTGGAGYIGAHMALALCDRGERVVVLDNLSTGRRWSVPAGAVFVEGDVGDFQLVSGVLREHGVDAVAHFAANTVVPDSVADPLGYYRNNVVHSHTLLAAAAAAGVKHFVFSSSAAVYGEPESSPVAEDAALRPISPYGWSKLMTEQMLADAARAGELRMVALRYFNVAGADPAGRAGQSTPRATHLIKVAVEAALGVRPYLEIFGTDYPTPDGACVRDYIHVSDLIDAHLAALDRLRAGGESLVCNCGYGRGYSVLEVAAAVKRIAQTDFPVRFGPRRPGDPASVIAATDRIRAELNWRPQRDDLDLIVAHALSWERVLMARGDAS